VEELLPAAAIRDPRADINRKNPTIPMRKRPHMTASVILTNSFI
jgi:hypothetical protein